MQSNIFGGGGGGCLDDGSSLYMNTADGLSAPDITKSSPPLTPSSSSRGAAAAAAALMKHDVGACLPGYGGVAYSAAAAAAAELGCRPFHSPASAFGESMLDQLQVRAAAAASRREQQATASYSSYDRRKQNGIA